MEENGLLGWGLHLRPGWHRPMEDDPTIPTHIEIVRTGSPSCIKVVSLWERALETPLSMGRGNENGWCHKQNAQDK